MEGVMEELLGREGFGADWGLSGLGFDLVVVRGVVDLLLGRGVGRGAGEGTTAAASCSFLIDHTLSLGTGAGVFSSTTSTVGVGSTVGIRQLSEELEELGRGVVVAAGTGAGTPVVAARSAERRARSAYVTALVMPSFRVELAERESRNCVFPSWLRSWPRLQFSDGDGAA